jgi:type VI secretion system protein ImpG
VLHGAALLAARIEKRLVDGYTQFTEGLLESLYPHQLRPFPACAIVVFDLAGAASALRVIPRGTELKSIQKVASVKCCFRTATDVSLAPVANAAVTIDPLIKAPSATPLAPDVTAALSIMIESKSELPLNSVPLDRLRIFIDGDLSLSTALRDALFLHASGAFVEAADGRWQPLAVIPVVPAGLSDDEALIPYSKRSHPAWRVLTEYFCFPEKFRFVDIDLSTLRPLTPGGARRVTLHLALSRLPPDDAAARMLRTLLPTNLKLFCTPVVNLFAHHARPIDVTGTTADYPLVPDSGHPEGLEVYSVDAVRKQAKGGDGIVEFTPMHERRKGAVMKGHHWALRHDDILAEIRPGHEKRLSLVDSDLEATERSTVGVDITCTNRDLPLQLICGAPGGDLSMPSAADGVDVRLLTKPTQVQRFASGDAHWDLIACLSLNHHALIPDGLPALRKLLHLHNLPQSLVTERLIAGVVDLNHKQKTAWMPNEYGASLVYGIEVRITVEEEAFTGSGIHLFAQVMDQFLALYVQVNSFVELVLLSQRDKREIIRCKRRSGNASPA